MATPTFLLYLINYHSDQSDSVDTDKQDIISQHTKGTPTISAPSIYSTTCNPNWVQDNKGRIRHGCGHNDSTANRYSPSNDLKTKTYSMAFVIFFDPVECSTKYFIHYSGNRLVTPKIISISFHACSCSFQLSL